MANEKQDEIALFPERNRSQCGTIQVENQANPVATKSAINETFTQLYVRTCQGGSSRGLISQMHRKRRVYENFHEVGAAFSASSSLYLNLVASPPPRDADASSTPSLRHPATFKRLDVFWSCELEEERPNPKAVADRS